MSNKEKDFVNKLDCLWAELLISKRLSKKRRKIRKMVSKKKRKKMNLRLLLINSRWNVPRPKNQNDRP